MHSLQDVPAVPNPEQQLPWMVQRLTFVTYRSCDCPCNTLTTADQSTNMGECDYKQQTTVLAVVMAVNSFDGALGLRMC